MADWHERYKRRYAEFKAAGKSFFPYAVVKDVLVAFLIFGVLAFLAWKVGAGLEGLADPTDTTYNPRPEWYFLFLFQALKAFPGSLESVAAVILPGIFVAFLILLPFLDRGPRRHPLDRPFLTGAGVLGMLVVAGLTIAGYRSPLLNPTVKRDPRVMVGARLYRQLHCEYCHKIGQHGGTVGPALDRILAQSTDQWLEAHFKDPRKLSPRTKMPQFNLLDDEIRDLIAYLRSIELAPYTKEAPKLFTADCAVCHTVNGEGGDVGPNLSAIGAARGKAFIASYVTDPTRINPSSLMPSFKGQLTDVQIEDLARYLSSLGR